MRPLPILTACLLVTACGGKAIQHVGEDDGSGGFHDGSGGFDSAVGGGFIDATGGAVNAGGTVGGGGVFGIGGGTSMGGSEPAIPSCSRTVQDDPCRLPYGGVNLAGAEFGSTLPGVYGKDYIYPGVDDVNYFASRGMNIVRLPFRWERLQRTLRGPLDANELHHIQEVVKLAQTQHMTVILDPHNYARYQVGTVERVLGGGSLSSADLADFWGKLATAFKDSPSVWFGLMNEPHDLQSSVWLDAANASLAAIRNAGAAQLVLVPGNHWTGAHSWVNSDNGSLMLGVVDPMNNFAYEVHQYLDANYSGQSENCTVTDAQNVLGSFTEWARAVGAHAFLGEFGGGTGDDCQKAISSVMGHLEENSDVWLGWTYWAGGPWWGDYFTSISPAVPDQDKPQMKWLLRHMP